MTEPAGAEVIVYVCANCTAEGPRLPRRWKQNGAEVLVQEVPCSGKTELQYLFRAFEGGGRGVCVVTCPRGECQLAQGNYRAEMRIRTLRRLLGEIGLEPERAELVQSSPQEPLEQLVRDAVERISALGESSLRTATPQIES